VRVKPPAGWPWSVTDHDRRRRQTPATITSVYTLFSWLLTLAGVSSSWLVSTCECMAWMYIIVCCVSWQQTWDASALNHTPAHQPVPHSPVASVLLHCRQSESLITSLTYSWCCTGISFAACTLYGLRGGNAPWFMRWFRRYINCWFVCLLNFLTHFLPSLLSFFFMLSFFLIYFLLVYFMTYLFTSSFVSDIAVFMLKRNVKLQQTSYFFKNVPIPFPGRRS